jgi:phage baseplate assembly protein W
MSAIFQTEPGERVMQPDNGAAVGLFEPVRDTSEMTQAARQVVAEHEPRVEPDSIDVTIDQIDASGRLEVTASYQIVGEANPRTLTFPFFKRES